MQREQIEQMQADFARLAEEPGDQPSQAQETQDSAGPVPADVLRDLMRQVPDLTAECLCQLDVLQSAQERIPQLRQRCQQLTGLLEQVRQRLLDQLCNSSGDGSEETHAQDVPCRTPAEATDQLDEPWPEPPTQENPSGPTEGGSHDDGIDILDGETMDNLGNLYKAAEENDFTQDPSWKMDPDLEGEELEESSEEMIERSEHLDRTLDEGQEDPEVAKANRRNQALSDDDEDDELNPEAANKKPKLLEEIYPDALGAMDYPTQVAMARLDRGARKNNFVEMENEPDDLDLLDREVEASRKAAQAESKPWPIA